MSTRLNFPLLIIIVAYGFVRAAAGELSESDLRRVGYDQHLGMQVDPGLVFQESTGRQSALRDFFNAKPTLLVLGYYRCPMLCTLINDGLIESLQELRLQVGRDFNINNVSIDPGETTEIARARKREYLKRYGRPGAEPGWHFLTGNAGAIGQLANECGFRFQRDSESREFAHPSGFVVLTPEGRISRYFFGVNFDPRELQSAIIASSRGEGGSLIKDLVLLCCRYNPITGRYGNVILIVLRVLGVSTVTFLAGWILLMIRGDVARMR